MYLIDDKARFNVSFDGERYDDVTFSEARVHVQSRCKSLHFDNLEDKSVMLANLAKYGVWSQNFLEKNGQFQRLWGIITLVQNENDESHKSNSSVSLPV